ncbi:uncharacterized protein LOC114576563 [Exaiptasia diaphana]|uniref:Uncharacterized protein n=1 Tax=Exaiptasia diaphana TaxID=2652724 RepID=A0A913YYN1_EXADI|nr:uncharacterized protein LOC114576563 [Exaiptasia diaphana]
MVFSLLVFPGQISFVQQMGQYQKNKFNTRSSADTLDEKECGMATNDDPTDSESFSQHGSSKLNSKTATDQVKNQDSQEIDPAVDQNTDEDVTIEDFEDEW